MNLPARGRVRAWPVAVSRSVPPGVALVPCAPVDTSIMRFRRIFLRIGVCSRSCGRAGGTFAALAPFVDCPLSCGASRREGDDDERRSSEPSEPPEPSRARRTRPDCAGASAPFSATGTGCALPVARRRSSAAALLLSRLVRRPLGRARLPVRRARRGRPRREQVHGRDADRGARKPFPPARPSTSSRACASPTSSSRAPAATFTVPTRDGFAVGLVLQARWALDRGQLLARWAGLPANPGAEVVGPVLASAFRALAPEYDAPSLLASKREELAARATKQADRAPRRGRDRPQGRPRRRPQAPGRSSSAAASRSSSSRSSSSAPRRTSGSRSRRSSSSGSRPRPARRARTRRPRRPRTAGSSRPRPSPTRWPTSCRSRRRAIKQQELEAEAQKARTPEGGGIARRRR